MLERLRQSVAGLLAKILIGLLVVSFSLWGIGDVFSPSQNPTIAEVGNKNISIKKFRRAFQQNFYQIQLNARQQGRSVSIEQVRAVGLDRQILSALIGQSALEQNAENIGMTISADELAKQIQVDPAFHGAFGKFDIVSFQNTLQASGFTEEEYLEERKNAIIRQQLITVFTARPLASNQLVKLIYSAQNQRRVAEYIILKPSQIPSPKLPNEEVLNEFISSQPKTFTAPEKRKFSLLLLDPKKFTARINISNKKLLEEYNIRIDEFKTDETRLVQQIVFNSKKEALLAKKKYFTSSSFIKLARGLGLNKDDISLGWLKKGDYLSPSIEKSILKLSKGKISQPLETDFGWVLMRVADIKPSKQKTFNKVRAQLKQRLAYNIAQDEIDELHDLIEDEIAGGEALKSVAKKYKLGLTKSKLLKQEDSLPKIKADIKGIKERIWARKQEEVLQVAQTDDGGYYWLAITEIKPARLQSLKEASSKAIKLWKKEEKFRLLKIKAEKISKEVASGKKLATITKQKLQRTPPLARSANDKVLTTEMIGILFRTPKFGTFNGPAKTSGEIVVAQVSKISAFRENSKNRKELLERIKQEIANLSANEMITQYLAQTQKELGVSVFENNLELAFEQTQGLAP